MLQVLGTSKLATKEELIVFESLTTPQIEALAPEPHEGDDGKSREEGNLP